MARPAEEEIERLKREVSLERLAEARGVELERRGEDRIGLCPWHEGGEPSLVISPKTNLFRCEGVCQMGGNVIDWVMRAEAASFRHAVELLREGYPSLQSASGHEGKAAWSRKLPSPVTAEADDPEMMRQVVDYYHETLKTSPEALAYLEKRGIRNAEAIERFKLGYGNRTLGLRLPIRQTKEGGRIRARLAALGVFRESGHEHLSGSVVIPILSQAGEVLGMYGRKIRDDLREGTPTHLYLSEAHRGVWNEEALATWKEVILCASLIDALSFWCAGYRNVTASWGPNGFTEDHRAAFKKHGTQRVLIAYRRDEAGEKAAEALAPQLIAAGLEVFRVQFPHGMDANEYSLKAAPADESLGQAIRKASWVGGVPAPATAPAPVAADTVKQPPASEPPPLPAQEAVVERKPEAIEEPKPVLKKAPPVPRKPPPPADSPAAPVVPLPASPSPELPPVNFIEVELKGDEVVARAEGRRYRVRGLAKNTSAEQLKVNILASKGDQFHVDNFDLYSSRLRSVFIAQAARELCEREELIRKDIGRLLLKLEELHEEAVKKAVEPKKRVQNMTDAEYEAAKALLSDRGLVDRILADFQRCGVVGEETNMLVGYLAALSRRLDEPLAVVIQSSSAAGKSSLMEAVLAFTPEEERVKYSAVTGQSLFYVGEQDLAHKILAVVEEQGATKAAYSLKLLQSEGELSIASTGKDPSTGRLVTHEYRVKGPVMIFLTTTAPEIDEELLNRCIVLTVDEEREQTRAIHKLQRERQTLEGLLARQGRTDLVRLHQNAQRLLRPLLVANPFARALTFLDDRTRTRRDHVKYLTLIRTITLLHQHQRPVKVAEQAGRAVEYIEATMDDIALANRLAHQILGRSLDELPPQTRRLLGILDRLVTERARQPKRERSEVRFSRRELRAAIGWGNTQLKVHLARLVELEYLVVHPGDRGQRYAYELVYDGKGKEGAPFLTGLIDIETLRAAAYDRHRSGEMEEWSASGRPPAGVPSGGGPGEESAGSPSEEGACADGTPGPPDSAHLDEMAKSHVVSDRRPVSPSEVEA